MSFVPDTTILAQFALASIILAITPGPDMTLFLSRALSDGPKAGFACMAGALSGLAVHTGLVVLGLSALIVAAPQAFLALKIVGALYLLWLAYQAIRHGTTFKPEVQQKTSRSLASHWLAGLGINLANPKIILFFMTFLPQFVSVNDPNATGKLIFLSLMFMAIAIPIVSPMILAAHHFADALRNHPRSTRILDWLFAGVFSVFAVGVLFTDNK